MDGSILQAKEIEALFGGFNKTFAFVQANIKKFQLKRLSCHHTLQKLSRLSHFRQLSLGQLNMDEQDACSLLQNLRFVRSPTALRVQSEDQRDSRCYTTKLNKFGSCTSEIHKTLNLDGISLTPEAAAALGRSFPVKWRPYKYWR